MFFFEFVLCLSVQAALFGSFVFPPPTTSAKLFAKAYSAGARRTANAGKKLVMQSVVVKLIDRDVVPHITPCPVGQGVEFDLIFGSLVGTVDQWHVRPIA